MGKLLDREVSLTVERQPSKLKIVKIHLKDLPCVAFRSFEMFVYIYIYIRNKK